MEYAICDMDRRAVLARLLYECSANHAAACYRASLGAEPGSLRVKVFRVPVGGDPFARTRQIKEVAHGTP